MASHSNGRTVTSSNRPLSSTSCLLSTSFSPGGQLADSDPFLANLVVDILNINEEGVDGLGQDVGRPPKGKVGSGPEQLPCPLVTHGRVDPMPSRGGEDEAETLALWRLPGFEGAFEHLGSWEAHEVAPRLSRQLRAELDASDPETAPQKWESRLARAAADFEKVIAGLEAGKLDQRIEELVGVVRAGLVVALGRGGEACP